MLLNNAYDLNNVYESEDLFGNVNNVNEYLVNVREHGQCLW
jgi:hypothetical protein